MPDRNPFEGRDVKSRRVGKVKELLSRDRIIDEALNLLAREGLEGMSVRRVAAALETGPASLYAYVDDLDSLRALVLDRALEEVVTALNRHLGWRARVKAVLASYGRVLMETPGLASLALTIIAAGPNSLRIIEALLEALDAGGVDAATAAWAVDLLLLYVTAISVEHTTDQTPSLRGPIAYALRTASSETFPRVHAARDELLSGDGHQRFDWALETLLTGVLHNPRQQPAAQARRSSKSRRKRPGSLRR